MSEQRTALRVAMPAWEIGRESTGLGEKVGGLGVIVEELPPELVRAAPTRGIDLEIAILTPCFAHYDRAKMKKLPLEIPVAVGGHTFVFEIYEHLFSDGQKVVYFWNHRQLGSTGPGSIYPSEPLEALDQYASLAQAMAGYIGLSGFDTVHLHDHHVGFVPFYLGERGRAGLPVHLTIHNGSYQGVIPANGDGQAVLDRVGLSGDDLFRRYFDYFGDVNLLKGCMLKVHESGGRVTTVSGDLAGTWGYAAELRRTEGEIWARARAQKGSPPGEIFVPNQNLDLFVKLPIAGITNGMGDRNRPENLPELKAAFLRQAQKRLGTGQTLFRDPTVQKKMLARDHTFDRSDPAGKSELKRLLHREAFGADPQWDPILFTAVGRLVAQKNFGLVADVIERALDLDHGVKFVVLASAPDGEVDGKADEARLLELSLKWPDRVFFRSEFDGPLSKLILAGGDFTLIPSRFEPCGLVDFEASLLGTVVVGHATGGLTKVRHCAYLYEWLDVSDRGGEADALFRQIERATVTYRDDPERHGEMKRDAMAIDASWDGSAGDYVDLYRYGLIARRWAADRRRWLRETIRSLGEDRVLFDKFFAPGLSDYGDLVEAELRRELDAVSESSNDRRRPAGSRTPRVKP